MPISKCVPCFTRSTSPCVTIRTTAREYHQKYHCFCHLSLASLSPPTRSRFGTQRIKQGEERWSRASRAALEPSDVTEKFEVQQCHTEADTEKNSLPTPASSTSYTSMYIYKGFAWAPAFAGAYASSRAGQYFDKLSCSCPT